MRGMIRKQRGKCDFLGKYEAQWKCKIRAWEAVVLPLNYARNINDSALIACLIYPRNARLTVSRKCAGKIRQRGGIANQSATQH